MAKEDIEKLQSYSKKEIRQLAVKAIIGVNKEKIEYLVKLLNMRREGESYRKIAQQLGLKSQETVRYWLNKINKIDDN